MKINLEWDETGQETRLRRGLIEISGVLPVLVSRTSCVRDMLLPLCGVKIN